MGKTKWTPTFFNYSGVSFKTKMFEIGKLTHGSASSIIGYSLDIILKFLFK